MVCSVIVWCTLCRKHAAVDRRAAQHTNYPARAKGATRGQNAKIGENEKFSSFPLSCPLSRTLRPIYYTSSSLSSSCFYFPPFFLHPTTTNPSKWVCIHFPIPFSAFN